MRASSSPVFGALRGVLLVEPLQQIEFAALLGCGHAGAGFRSTIGVAPLRNSVPW